jgi:hypothetical protein
MSELRSATAVLEPPQEPEDRHVLRESTPVPIDPHRDLTDFYVELEGSLAGHADKTLLARERTVQYPGEGGYSRYADLKYKHQDPDRTLRVPLIAVVEHRGHPNGEGTPVPLTTAQPELPTAHIPVVYVERSRPRRYTGRHRLNNVNKNR